MSENFRKVSKGGSLDLGYPRLSLAVIKRSEAELRKLIKRGHNVEGESRNCYSPLSLAIGWTAGIRILLEAGADPFQATLYAIGRGDEASMEMLLPECPLFQSHPRNLHERSVLSYALWAKGTPTTIRLIAKELANNHQQLTNLALQNLSHRQLRSFGLTLKDGNISSLQGKEHQVMTALSSRGIEIPAKTLPCPYTSVYHDKRMTVYAADELWARGVCNIDLPDAMGRTPLILACSTLQLPDGMISWYINKGARVMEFPQLGIKSYLHVVAAVLGGIDWIIDHKYDLSKLNELCSPTLTDSCTCQCSSDGCSPVKCLLGNGWDFEVEDWERKSRTLFEWFNSGRIDSSEQEKSCLEACRFEVFERLGMAHTCCQFNDKDVDGPSDDCPVMVQMPEDEQSELQDEDRCAGLVQALQAYMQLYGTLRVEYPEPIPIFWKAWWSTLTDLLPERGGLNCRDVLETDSEISSDDPSNSGPVKGRGLPKDEEINAQNKSDDQVPDEVSGDCGPNEKEICSRMEVLLAGEGLGLMEDVFSDDETQHSDSECGNDCDCYGCQYPRLS